MPTVMKMFPCSTRTSGRDTMASNNEAVGRATANWPRCGPAR
jgi:hypothetical protein